MDTEKKNLTLKLKQSPVGEHDKDREGSNTPVETSLPWHRFRTERDREIMFPGKLMALPSVPDIQHVVVSWMPHDIAFKIHNPVQCVEEVLVESKVQYASFLRYI